MRRTRDPAEVDRWVRRDFPDAGSLAGMLSDELNVCLAEGEGGAIFVWRGPGIYESHCFYERRGRDVLNRGREGLAVTQAMLDHMRRHYGATMFWAAIPDDGRKDTRKVKIFVRMLGWRSVGHADFAHGHCELFTGE